MRQSGIWSSSDAQCEHSGLSRIIAAAGGVVSVRRLRGFLSSYLFSGYFIRDIDDLRGLITAVRQKLVGDGIAYAEVTVSIPEYLMHGIALEAITEALSEQSGDETPRPALDRRFRAQPGRRGCRGLAGKAARASAQGLGRYHAGRIGAPVPAGAV
ncbi:MAG: hypothetical protein R2748_17415 [Bryobacterales bacterium]